jgi:hypothetical protein
MTTEKQAGMPDVIWIGDIEGSHCRCWNGPTYGGFRGEGHISEPYIRRAIVTPEAAKDAADDLQMSEDHWCNGENFVLKADICKTLRALLIAHGGGG